MDQAFFIIQGEPIPQGSKSVAVRGSRAVMFEANPRHKNFRQHSEDSIRRFSKIVGYTSFPKGEPLEIELEFFLSRPKSVKRMFPSVKPDGDKLTRSICDSIVKAGIVPDDSQFVDYIIRKRYADESGPRTIIRIKMKNVTDL